MLEEIAFAMVVHSWRRAAHTMEAEARLMEPQNSSTSDQLESSRRVDSKAARWYATDRKSLRDAIKFLLNCKQTFEDRGEISDEQRRDLARFFGEDFLADLIDWAPPSLDAALLADMLVQHGKNFNLPLPELGKDQSRTILDPTQSRQMVGRLIDERLRHLRDLLTIGGKVADFGCGAFDSSSHHVGLGNFADALLDMARAVAFFDRLKSRQDRKKRLHFEREAATQK